VSGAADSTPGGRDVFDDLFALLSPQRLLADSRATGEGVRVAIVDSGVDREIVERRFRQREIEILPIEGGVFLPREARPQSYTGRHSAPHGTTVADILLSIAPRVKLFSADVFGPQGSCEVETIIQAMYWVMDEWKCKIINLSLGVAEERLQQPTRRQQLLRAIEEAYHRDVLVFAAAHNEHPITKSYPAVFAPPLISVDKRFFPHALQFAYAPREQIEFQAHSQGYIGPFSKEAATSWATPHLAGIAARILSLRPEMKPFEIKTVLYWMSRHFDD
jgi:subtilisin family serine protease